MKNIAIVGGGITGSTCCSVLSRAGGFAVTLFDQGQRGPGGRMSHRRIERVTQSVVADDLPMNQVDDRSVFDSFDHGCQFFFASTDRFKVWVNDWVAADVARDWTDRRPLWIPEQSGTSQSPSQDFFGLLEYAALPCYTGVGGMHQIARHQCNTGALNGATIMSGTRVSGIEAAPSSHDKPRWELFGTSGTPAFHNTAEDDAKSTHPSSLGQFDAVIFTDPSSCFDKWHRASAGLSAIAPAMAATVQARPRIPLFTTMIAFDSLPLPFDSIVWSEGPLWYACRNNAKPRLNSDRECWTLVSTPAFACNEITEVPMVLTSSPVDGQPHKTFLPQDNAYLNSGPAQVLSEAFLNTLMSEEACGVKISARPKLLYLQGQRWGSAIPGDRDAADLVEIAGTKYQRSIPNLATKDTRVIPLMTSSASSDAKVDFLSDDSCGLYYCGDFCSYRVAGVEAAVLSAEDCARHVIKVMSSEL